MRRRRPSLLLRLPALPRRRPLLKLPAQKQSPYTEPDSKIRISSVTTLGSEGEKGGLAGPKEKNPTQEAEEDQEDMNLMITSVTSLQDGGAAVTVAGEGQLEENGLQISSSFSLTPETPSGRPTASFNPGRGQLVQNGDSGTHNRAGNASIMQRRRSNLSMFTQ
ncbi:hypothetical protein F7725_002368, partial [Dissostichus mawsoni]